MAGLFYKTLNEMSQNSVSIFNQITTNADSALQFVIKTNPEAVYDNLINAGVSISPNATEILTALRQLVAAGEKKLVAQILNVPVNADNLTEPEYQAYLNLKTQN